MNRRMFVCLVLLVGAFLAACLSAPPVQAASPASTSDTGKPRIVLVGDSTVTDRAGWGAAFAKLVEPPAVCINCSRGGASTKSYRDQGLWKKALAEKPDFILIQFGHNDQPGKGPARETDVKTTYRDNLRRYVDEARAAGATPILCTSITRRRFNAEGKIQQVPINDQIKAGSTLSDYAEAVRIVAKEKHVPLVDLHARTIAELERIGPQAAKAYDRIVPEDGSADHTHLSPHGAAATAALVADEIRKAVPQLASCLKSTTAKSTGQSDQ